MKLLTGATTLVAQVRQILLLLEAIAAGLSAFVKVMKTAPDAKKKPEEDVILDNDEEAEYGEKV